MRRKWKSCERNVELPLTSSRSHHRKEVSQCSQCGSNKEWSAINWLPSQGTGVHKQLILGQSIATWSIAPTVSGKLRTRRLRNKSREISHNANSIYDELSAILGRLHARPSCMPRNCMQFPIPETPIFGRYRVSREPAATGGIRWPTFIGRHQVHLLTLPLTHPFPARYIQRKDSFSSICNQWVSQNSSSRH